MKPPPPEVMRRLLFVLNHGLSQIRNLAVGEGHDEIAELADALKTLPRMIDNWEDESADLLHFVLANYQKKFPGRAFDYVAHAERYDAPERF